MDPDRFIIEDEFVKVEGDTRLSYVSVWLRSKVDQKVTIGEHNYVMSTYRNQKAEVIFVNLISLDRNFQQIKHVLQSDLYYTITSPLP